MNRNELAKLLKEHGQEQLMAYYDKAAPEGRAHLAEQLEQLDWALIASALEHKSQQKKASFEPLAGISIEQIMSDREKFDDIGIKALQAGKAAVVLLAGGQGTRLGCDGPKGIVNIGLTKDVYIFELLIQSLKRVVERAGVWIPFYIMTSDKNNAQTVDFLRQHRFFGYPEEYVTFFIQDMSPAVDFKGKLLMEAPDSLALSPNGNGGWFSSMVKAGLLSDLHRRGIEWLNVFPIDNVLQRIADPVFIGATIDSGRSCGAKVVRKANPNERVGVLCLEDGRPSIVEYYEMTDEMIHRRNGDGGLSYAFGVILNYLFRVDRLEEIAGIRLPIHVAEKKIPYLTADGQYIEPDAPNGYKFEELVLDMVHLFDSCLPFEIVREQEFAPIKNADGDDSVVSARQLLLLNGYVL
jgi:UDP-N-acetylglucosamine/UDP-N-acetylgalactosamine diphosphorylase